MTAHAVGTVTAPGGTPVLGAGEVAITRGGVESKVKVLEKAVSGVCCRLTMAPATNAKVCVPLVKLEGSPNVMVSPSTMVSEVAAATPLGRWGGEQEIVKAVLALIDTDFITGETVRVDGGRHLR